MYPCYTTEAARVLCRFDLVDESAVRQTVSYLLADSHASGGWRCNFSKFGGGPESQYANPGATLYALDVIRHVVELRSGNDVVDHGVESLLRHWENRTPTGPCHWGIGTRFRQVEFPFLRYNLFFYVYALSFFDRAKSDPRFLSALEALQSKLDSGGRIVVENPHRRLARLRFCERGAPSEIATKRFLEIGLNMTSA